MQPGTSPFEASNPASIGAIDCHTMKSDHWASPLASSINHLRYSTETLSTPECAARRRGRTEASPDAGSRRPGGPAPARAVRSEGTPDRRRRARSPWRGTRSSASNFRSTGDADIEHVPVASGDEDATEVHGERHCEEIVVRNVDPAARCVGVEGGESRHRLLHVARESEFWPVTPDVAVGDFGMITRPEHAIMNPGKMGEVDEVLHAPMRTRLPVIDGTVDHLKPRVLELGKSWNRECRFISDRPTPNRTVPWPERESVSEESIAEKQAIVRSDRSTTSCSPSRTT